jgi:hypothetical protein
MQIENFAMQQRHGFFHAARQSELFSNPHAQTRSVQGGFLYLTIREEGQRRDVAESLWKKPGDERELES